MSQSTHKMSQFIDFHLHFDDKKFESIELACQALGSELLTAGGSAGLVLHLLTQPWSVEDIAVQLRKQTQLIGFVNVDPLSKNAEEQLEVAINRLGFKGLKLHPRLNGYSMQDPKLLQLMKKAESLEVPILIDAFPDGNSLMDGFDVNLYGILARKVPNIPVIAAHLGGIRCLEMMLMAKRVENLFVDLSYSLLYFRESSLTQDLVYCVKSMKADKVFYGSDSPDRSIEKSFKLSLEEFKRFGLKDEYIEKVIYHNANQFMQLHFE